MAYTPPENLYGNSSFSIASQRDRISGSGAGSLCRIPSPTISSLLAEATAERFGVTLAGGNGVISALAAVALAGLPHEVLLDPARSIW